MTKGGDNSGDISAITSILNHLPIVVYEKNTALKFTYASPGLLSLLEITEGNLIGKSIEEIPLLRKCKFLRQSDRFDRKVLETGKPREDLEERWVTPIRDIYLQIWKYPVIKGGIVTGVLSVGIRVENSEPNDESLDVLQSMIDAVPYPVFYIGNDCRYRAHNRAAEICLGGNDINGLIAPEHFSHYFNDPVVRENGSLRVFPRLGRDGEKIDGLIGIACPTNKAKRSDSRDNGTSKELIDVLIATSSDSIGIVSCTDGTILTANDKFRDLFGIGKIDINEIRKSSSSTIVSVKEVTFGETPANLVVACRTGDRCPGVTRSGLFSLEGPFFEILSDGRIKYFSNEARSLLGCSLEKVVKHPGKNMSSFICSADRRRFREFIRALVGGETKCSALQCRVLHIDGTTLPVTIYASPVGSAEHLHVRGVITRDSMDDVALMTSLFPAG